jgi:tetratricopeptide (TPR) repeat protein
MTHHSLGDWFTGNAYRILGVRSDATAGRIVKATEALLRSLSIGEIVRSPWDVPCLGMPPCRTEDAVLEAAAQLTHPVKRLLHRLFWFHQSSDALQGLSPASLPIIASDWAHSTKLERMHDGTLLCLIMAQSGDPELRYELRWTQAMRYWQRVLASDHYWHYFVSIELGGDFHPCAAPAMLQEFRKNALDFAMESLVDTIEHADASRDKELYARGVRIVRHLEFPVQSFEHVDGTPHPQTVIQTMSALSSASPTTAPRKSGNRGRTEAGAEMVPGTSATPASCEKTGALPQPTSSQQGRAQAQTPVAASSIAESVSDMTVTHVQTPAPEPDQIPLPAASTPAPAIDHHMPDPAAEPASAENADTPPADSVDHGPEPSLGRRPEESMCPSPPAMEAADFPAGITSDALTQISEAARLLQHVKALLPPASKTLQTLEESQAKLQASVVANFEELCAEIVLGCHREDRETDAAAEASADPLDACERAMQRYEHEVKPQISQVIALVGDNGELARRAWEAAAFCLYCLVVVWPWDDAYTRADVLLETAREHLPAESMALRRIESHLMTGADPLSASIAGGPGGADGAAVRRQSSTRRGLAIRVVLLSLCLLAFFALLFSSYQQAQRPNLRKLQAHLQQDNQRVTRLHEHLQRIDKDMASLEKQVNAARRTISDAESKRGLGIYYSEEAYQQAVEAYNALVPQYNQYVIERNDVVNDYLHAMESHNRLVNQYNDLFKQAGQSGKPLVTPALPLKMSDD